MKDLWFPLFVLLGIITIALTGGAKNYQNNSATSNPPVVNPPITPPPPDTSPYSYNSSPGSLPSSVSNSPYASKASLQWGGYGSNNPNQEYIQVSANSANTTPLDITGWTLHSKWTGQNVTIPQSVSLYFANSSNGKEDVRLAPGERAFIISGRSPLGVGMHVNICSGYLSQWNPNSNQQLQFNPSLYTSCPSPRDENFSSIPRTPNNANCFDLINSLGSCQNGPTLNNTYSYECQQFVETKLNYQTCVDTHKNDPNFYSPDEWYVYLNSDQTAWQYSRYEDVVLLDQNGKQIAEIKGY